MLATYSSYKNAVIEYFFGVILISIITLRELCAVTYKRNKITALLSVEFDVRFLWEETLTGRKRQSFCPNNKKQKTQGEYIDETLPQVSALLVLIFLTNAPCIISRACMSSALCTPVRRP